MDVRSAELTKYAANAMLATKISFMNELANIAERLGADIEQVRIGIGSDPRIGYHFIYPGCGYGGSCFPKDVQGARTHRAGRRLRGATAAGSGNRQSTAKSTYCSQKSAAIRRPAGRRPSRSGVWRSSPIPTTCAKHSSRTLMEALWQAGAQVRAYDPEAMDETRRIYGERSDLTLCSSLENTLQGSDALVVMTEWNQFRSPDFFEIKDTLKDPVIFDGRNLYEPRAMAELGFVYYAIGRGERAPD